MDDALDTLQVTKRLKETHFSEPQAETLAELFREREAAVLVTRSHLDVRLRELEMKMKIYNGSLAVAIITVLSLFQFFN